MPVKESVIEMLDTHELQTFGLVVAVGAGVISNVDTPNPAKVDDTVMVFTLNTVEVEWEGEKLLMVLAENIVGIE